ncbi:hypothetical protein [Enterobacter sp. JUb54]|uniref:hypothetical protein n=1 Tax=Enterobacteriaceae TaxID=543 RepID=UPI00164D41C8|nr:hypothetical protein [Enterobacter sp. JUb54]QNK07780.1 hypothetical protein HF679_24035 [Enterobacter sp. JUb54]
MCANIFPEAAHGACPGYNIAACSPVSAAPPGTMLPKHLPGGGAWRLSGLQHHGM